MELRQLRYFVTLAERLHFQAASVELCITQPALSSALKALEDEIGAVLIDRSRKRQIRLTPAGEAFLRGAHQTLHASQRAAHNALAVKEGMSGTLSVGHTDDFATDVIPTIMLEYGRNRPEILMNFHQGVSFHLPDLLRQGEVDCLLETYPLPRPMTNSVTMALKSTPLVLMIPSDHRLSQYESVGVEQIIGEKNLYVPTARRSAYEFAIERLFGANGTDTHSQIGPTSTTLQIEFVRRAKGISLSTRGTFPQGVEGIKTIPIDHPDAELNRVLVWRKDNPNPALPHFIDYLRNTWAVDAHGLDDGA